MSRKNLALIVFVSLITVIFSGETFAKQTYHVQGGVYYPRTRVPVGTPTRPSKAFNKRQTLKIYNPCEDEDNSECSEYEDEMNESASQKNLVNQSHKSLSTSAKKKKTKTKVKEDDNSNKDRYKNSYGSYISTVKAYNKINEIGEELLNANLINSNIAFTLSSGREENAYANSYNQIVIYKGLLKFVETDDELAAVMSHELGHLLANDPRRLSRKIAVLNGLAVLAGDKNPNIVPKGSMRRMEYAADIAGVDIMVNAGYNPLAMISIQNKITDHYNDRFSTHPTGRKRLLAIYNYIEKYYPQYLDDGYPTVSYRSVLRIIGKN